MFAVHWAKEALRSNVLPAPKKIVCAPDRHIFLISLGASLLVVHPSFSCPVRSLFISCPLLRRAARISFGQPIGPHDPQLFLFRIIHYKLQTRHPCEHQRSCSQYKLWSVHSMEFVINLMAMHGLRPGYSLYEASSVV